MTDHYYAAFAHYLNSGDDRALTEFLEDDSQRDILAVYRNGYLKACVDALEANYPITQQLLSAELFSAIARKYVELSPPSKPTLVGYGDNFSEFLANPSRKILMSLPAVAPELALLDHHWLSALNSPIEAQGLTSETVLHYVEAGKDPALEVVELNSSVYLAALNFNSFELWQWIKTHEQVPERFHLEKGFQPMLFWRQDQQVRTQLLTPAEFYFFESLVKSPKQLGKLLERTLHKFPEFDITEHFSNCLTQQLLKIKEPQ